MSTTDQSLISLTSADVRSGAKQAWEEARPIAEPLLKPRRSKFARFFPTDACEAPINAAILELFKANADATRNRSHYKTGGFVFFPGESSVGEAFTMMIPLEISGDVRIEGQSLDVNLYYHILRKSWIQVPEGAKLVVLLVDSE